MTRSLSEDTPGKQAANYGFRIRQLERRPAPTPAQAAIPWARRSKGFDAANQTIANNSYIDLTYNHDYNMGAGESGEAYFTPYDGSGTTDGIEILQDGAYMVVGEVNWSSAMGTTAWLMGFSLRAPTQDYNSLDAKGASSSTTMTGIVSKPMRLTAGRIVILQVWQITGSDKDIDAAFLEIWHLGSYTGTNPEDMNPNA